ncbi:uncharacterized protein LOC129760900 [Uranotaenia lowii]|uniref:uncharacterized protein LOC129760900 n=1 Tax=Uranotaenia lowii TaxID=190385 RepID=UPI002479C286|nr:uncharacterized protein LOC129760900 [Uranotaenia lowii]
MRVFLPAAANITSGDSSFLVVLYQQDPEVRCPANLLGSHRAHQHPATLRQPHRRIATAVASGVQPFGTSSRLHINTTATSAGITSTRPISERLRDSQASEHEQHLFRSEAFRHCTGSNQGSQHQQKSQVRCPGTQLAPSRSTAQQRHFVSHRWELETLGGTRLFLLKPSTSTIRAASRGPMSGN